VPAGLGRGLWIRVDPRFELGYSNGDYEPWLQELLRAQLRPGDCFYDIGAHTGFFALIATTFLGPSGKVVAFEPDPDNAAGLHANLAKNSITQVMVVQAAVWSSAGHLTFQRALEDSNRTQGQIASSQEFSLGKIVSVHIVFAEYARKNKESISLSRNAVSSWPRLLHRKLYYQLIILLEKRIYTKRRTKLVLTAKKTFEQLKRSYQLRDFCPVLYTGIEHHRFNPELRAKLRESARKALGLEPASFALLLIGNDWRNKGLPALCEALSLLSDLPVQLLVVSRENSSGAEELLGDSLLKSRVHFLPTRADVEFYYSAADAYAGPSRQDTFALPPAEAMACGLPVIVSAEMGASEIITHDVDGMILRDPKDASRLAQMIRRIVIDPDFRRRLGENAARTARQYTWERNARELEAILFEALQGKGRLAQETAAEGL